MSATGRTATADAAGDLAGAVREADFVALVAAADGDALAAAGLLARGCRAADVPFQANVARTDAARERRLTADQGALGVLVGTDRGSADHALGARERPASVTAHAVAAELGAEPAPSLALAGAAAAGVPPGAGATADLLAAAEESDAVRRRPGVAIPVEDPTDGLVHQTIVHAPFAGDEAVAAELVADAGLERVDDPDLAVEGDSDDQNADDPATDSADDPDDDGHQRLASLMALSAAGDERATPRTADALERALRPYALADGPFATVGGYADVLEATARGAPGIGVALTLAGLDPADGLRASALDVWREHGRAAHAAVRSATTGRYDGLSVARLEEEREDVPVGTVARLLLDARSPEPAVLVVCDGEAAAAASADADVDAGDAMRRAVSSVGGEAGGDARRAYAVHDADPEAFAAAFRGVDP